MIHAHKIFKVGAKFLEIHLWVYATDSNVRRALKDDSFRAVCRKNTDGRYHIIVSRDAFTDGTLEHEISHIFLISKLKAHELQSNLAEQVTPWARQIFTDGG